jgi:uncharacterized protein GlcG (DUF336 family)
MRIGRPTAVALLACGIWGCGSPSQDAPSPATTQPGAAADAARQPRPGTADAACSDLPSASDLKSWLQRAPADGGEAGGLFSGKMEWGAIVDRDGELCATAVATDDPAAAWPGSQAIAKAKAYTANAFSTDAMPISTARLYTLTQPGHSLWGLGASNPFDPDCLAAPDDASAGNGKVCGGVITFGGGVPLYRGDTRVGGLGVSGDTACADHEIARRVRHLASLDPPKGEFADDIQFSEADGPSVFTHPLCANTWRNGRKIGEEAKASGY